MEDYALLEKIGEGTFGQVFRAKHRRTGEVLALKKVRLKRVEDGVAPATLRELKALQQLEHVNIVRLVDSFPLGSNVVLVLEHMHSDLARLLEHAPTRLCESDVKCLTLMLLHGVAACHSHSILHRVSSHTPRVASSPHAVMAGRQPPPNARNLSPIASALLPPAHAVIWPHACAACAGPETVQLAPHLARRAQNRRLWIGVLRWRERAVTPIVLRARARARARV